MSSQQEPLSASTKYRILRDADLRDYLAQVPEVAVQLGEACESWSVSEVGDGNLNLVFIVRGARRGIAVKQALPYVRLVGESWPLPLSRSHYEYRALVHQAKLAPGLVPAVLHHDEALAVTAMELLEPHIIMRKGLIAGTCYPHFVDHITTFLARTLFFSSDLANAAAQKKDGIAAFTGNHALCKITEDLIFTDPYREAEQNHWTSPWLDNAAAAIRQDMDLHIAISRLKLKFMTRPEALIHGDLHTGSIMVTDGETRVIDPEFAFYGPMGFDVGAIIGNFLLAYVCQRGHERVRSERDGNRAYLLEQIVDLWTTFARGFAGLWREHAQGDLYSSRILAGSPDLLEQAIAIRLQSIWERSVGFAGCKMIRRILGLAHVEDFESISDFDLRGKCEDSAVRLARDMLVNRHAYLNVEALVRSAREYA